MTFASDENIGAYYYQGLAYWKIMKSQVKWGIALIALGLAILPFGYPHMLVYAAPLVITGTAMIVFRNREVIIEEAETRWP
ncbi:MAG TPA: hypothetical protein PLQ49_04125 [Methanothrix sp.]|nr:hypothetical protein [Methanothrix sp.]